MEIETLKVMNEGIYLSSLMRVIEVIALIAILFAIAGFAIYLASILWFCFEETRQSTTAPRTARRASSPDTWKSAPRVLSWQKSSRIISEVTIGPLQPQPYLTETRRNER